MSASTNETITIRPTTEADIPRVMEVFAAAKGIMQSDGNCFQWTDAYPSAEVVRSDIRDNISFVCETSDGVIVGTFAFSICNDPTYNAIYDGEWIDDSRPYGVLHRLASTPDSHGVAVACFDFCTARISNLRADTYRDNSIMRHIFEKHGFIYCGIIHIANGEDRLAYQRIIAIDSTP